MVLVHAELAGRQLPSDFRSGFCPLHPPTPSSVARTCRSLCCLLTCNPAGWGRCRPCQWSCQQACCISFFSKGVTFLSILPVPEPQYFHPPRSWLLGSRVAAAAARAATRRLDPQAICRNTLFAAPRATPSATASSVIP